MGQDVLRMVVSGSMPAWKLGRDLRRIGNEGRTYIQTVLNKERDYAYAIDYYNGEVVTYTN